MSEAAGSLNRAALLVRAIARGGAGGAGLADLVAATALPRPTVHRVLDMLADIGWVERDAGSKRFYLGREIHALDEDLAVLGETVSLFVNIWLSATPPLPESAQAAARHPIERAATTELARLVEEIGQTVYLNIRAGLDAVCAARQESSARIQTLVLKVGSQVPIGRGAGSMALLAALPLSEAEAIITANRARYVAENAEFDEAAFRAALDEARRRGFASHDSLFTRGISGIGVAVRDVAGYPLAAVSTAFVGDWLGPEDRARFVVRLNEAAERISARLTTSRPA